MNQPQNTDSPRKPEQKPHLRVMSHDPTSKDIIKTLSGSPLYRDRMIQLFLTLEKVERGEI